MKWIRWCPHLPLVNNMEITFENVSKQYKKKYALKDIPTREAKDRVSEPDLSVYPGPGPPRC